MRICKEHGDYVEKKCPLCEKIKEIENLILEWETGLPICFTSKDFLKRLSKIIE